MFTEKNYCHFSPTKFCQLAQEPSDVFTPVFVFIVHKCYFQNDAFFRNDTVLLFEKIVISCFLVASS